jgi:hypothetical protein
MRTLNTTSIGLISMLFSVTTMQAGGPPATAEPKTEWQNITAGIAKTLGIDTREIPSRNPDDKPEEIKQCIAREYAWPK